jgi:hypothetical protein
MDPKYDIGKFDRKVSFQAVTSTKTAMGGPSKTYAHSFYWYMSREQAPSGMEQYIGGRSVILYRFFYRGHYKSAIVETMQIVDDSIKYNILSVNPSPDRMFVEIFVERVTE